MATDYQIVRAKRAVVEELAAKTRSRLNKRVERLPDVYMLVDRLIGALSDGPTVAELKQARTILWQAMTSESQSEVLKRRAKVT